MPEVHVTRRFPTYDFIIRTDHSVDENASRIENYLKKQTKPKGFVFFDSRVFGTWNGSEFMLMPQEDAFHGVPRPEANGYFVPQGDGSSDVVVRVKNSPMMIAILAGVYLVGLIVVIREPTLTPMLDIIFLTCGIFVLLLVTLMREGRRLSRVLWSVFTTGI